MPSKNKKTREAKEIVNTARRMTLPIKKPPKNSGAPRRSMRIQKRSENCQNNADCYLQSLLDPFKCKDVRIPSEFGPPSCTTSLFYRAFPALTGAAGRWVGGMRISPTLVNQLRTVTASLAVNNVTWTAGDHPKLTEMKAVSSYLRVVSMGMRVMDVGALVERGISMYVGSSPPSDSAVSPGAAVLDDITSSPNFELLDVAKLKAEGTTVVWIPFALGQSIVETNAAKVQPAGSTWRGYDNNVTDTHPLIYFVSTRSDTPSDEIAVEVVMNIEFMPNFANQYLFDPKFAPGGPANVAAATSALPKDKDTKAAMSTGHTGVYDMAKTLYGGAKSAWEFTRPGRQFLEEHWGTFNALLSPAKLADPLRPPPLKRYEDDDEKIPQLGSPSSTVSYQSRRSHFVRVD